MVDMEILQKLPLLKALSVQWLMSRTCKQMSGVVGWSQGEGIAGSSLEWPLGFAGEACI